MFCLYLQSSSASRQPKSLNLMFFANPVAKRVTLRNFSLTRPDTVPITGKYFIFIKNPQALLQSEKIRTLSFPPTLHIEYVEIQA